MRRAHCTPPAHTPAPKFNRPTAHAHALLKSPSTRPRGTPGSPATEQQRGLARAPLTGTAALPRGPPPHHHRGPTVFHSPPIFFFFKGPTPSSVGALRRPSHTHTQPSIITSLPHHPAASPEARRHSAPALLAALPIHPPPHPPPPTPNITPPIDLLYPPPLQYLPHPERESDSYPLWFSLARPRNTPLLWMRDPPPTPLVESAASYGARARGRTRARFFDARAGTRCPQRTVHNTPFTHTIPFSPSPSLLLSPSLCPPLLPSPSPPPPPRLSSDYISSLLLPPSSAGGVPFSGGGVLRARCGSAAAAARGRLGRPPPARV